MATASPSTFATRSASNCDVAPRHLTICECRPPWREDFRPEGLVCRVFYDSDPHGFQWS
jgi:hypothetical protein